jgi:hypothetical protein
MPKLDTGATYCIFKRVHGEELGLTIEDGEPLTMATPLGEGLDTFGHEVTIECFGYGFNSVVYFAAEEAFDRDVLGRMGWIQQFRLALVHHDTLLHLSHYDE